MENNSEPLVGLVVTESTVYTLDEFCCACTVQVEHVVALVDEGIVEPVSRDDTDDLLFSGTSLARARTALRLQRELEINLAGVALALDLMDEVKALRRRLLRLGITDV
jgi:chaperone modulatory protein CbpM